MRVLLFAFALALVAGCTAPAVAPAPSAAPLPVGPHFDAPVGMPQVGGGEPRIAITPTGTIFVNAPAGGADNPNVRQGAAYLWKSSDGGKTWSTLRQPNAADGTPASNAPVAPAFCSCDSDVVAGPDGWVYYTDWWIAGLVGPGNYLVEASHDDGATWTSNSVPIPQNLAASMDRQWLVAGPDGFVGLFYSFFGATPAGSLPVPAAGLDRPGGEIQAVYSHDHGATWTDPAPVVPASNDAYQIGHPWLAPNGTLMMAYGAVHPGPGNFWLDHSDVRLAWSTDMGKTWKDSLLAKVPLGFDNLWAVQGTVDASTGQSTVVWAGRLDGVATSGDALVVKPGSHMGVWVQQFGPLGTFDPVLIDGSGQGFLPWATARDGTTVVGWYGGNATGDMSKAPAASKWYAKAAVASAGHGIFAPGTFAVANVDATPVKTGPICPRGAACSGNRELLDYVGMVLDAKGGLHYTYTRSEQGQPHVFVAAQA